MDIASTFSLPTAPVEAQSAEQLAKRGQIEKTARDFEASFLSVMLGQMFKDVGAQAPFSGGHGEAAFKSFLGDAMAKQMVQHGGVGLADRVTQEMLKLQGLS
ncbi:rod-binding protein [Phenylobacterium sp.]|uniref:rod-binding protein n=1 Tax=Phenylobacterium sp. TaxID=1871053 RepID=UPI0035B03502